MKLIFFLAAMMAFTSCADFSKSFENKAVQTKNKKRKTESSKPISNKADISGTLASGTLYEATPEEAGFVISFEPFLAKNDEIFTLAAKQIIARLYSDTINDESKISIETDIDYTIFLSAKSRYKIVPVKESNGEISSIFIMSMM